MPVCLARSAPHRPDTGSENGDYVSHAKERLKQQATHLAGEVVDRASDIATELKDNAGAMAEAVKEQSAQLAGQATAKVQEWIGDVRDVPDHAASLARKAERSTQYLRDPDVRDNILLGIAGAAVVAALSVAYQRRTTE